MKVKRKVAALLALAMVVTGQPSGVLADGLNTLGTSYAAENSDAATGSEATDPTEPEKPELPEEELPEESTGAAEEPSKPEEETPTEEVTEEETEETKEETETEPTEEEEDAVYSVSYTVEPKGSAEIKGKEEVKEGKDLSFKVYPEEGYEIESVEVNGEEVTGSEEKKDWLFFGDTYYEYKVQDVEEDLDIAAYLKPEEVDEEKLTLIAEDGETKVTIQEKDADALKNVASVEITELEEDEAIEAALQDQVKEGDVSDYKAIDITLYDEDGNEVKPEGEVSVTVEGVSTDEYYDEVAIFHLQEQQNVRRPMRAPAANGISMLSEEEQPQAYVAEEVTKGVEDRTEKDKAVSFTTDHFSTYVITFIKNAEEFTDINVNAVVYNPDGNNSDPQQLNIGEHSVTIRIEEGTINIINIISGNNLSQIEADGKTYVYEFATWGNDVDAKIRDDAKIDYDMIASHKDDGIYIWYEDVSTQMVPVSVVFEDAEPVSGHEMAAGIVGYQKAQEAIKEDPGIWAYTGTYIVSKNTSDIKVKISSVRVLNGNYYVIPEKSTEEVPYSEEDFFIVLEFVEGRTITVHVTGADGDGNSVDGLEAGKDSFVRQAAINTEIQIPITIGFGYRLTIKADDADTGRLIYDSAQNYYRDKNYNLTNTQIGNANDIYVAFANMTDAPTLDYTHYIEEKEQGANSQYHGASLRLYESDEDRRGINLNNSDNPITVIKNGSRLEISGGDSGYLMNSLSINGYAITVPDDPERNGTLTETTIIPEDTNEPMARIIVTAKKESGWFGTTTRSYEIVFEEVNSNLIITDFNMTGSEEEARLRNVDDGVIINIVQNDGETQTHDDALKNGLWKFPIKITLTPELGYYVKNLLLNDNSWSSSFVSSEWYEPKTINSFDVSGNVNYVDIETEEITYKFEYQTDEEQTIIGDKEFNLGVDDTNTGKLDNNIGPSEVPTGSTFVGWLLNADDNPYDGNVAPDSAYGFLKEDIREKGEIRYYGQGQATVMLYPAYLPSNDAKNVPYIVEIYVDGVLKDTLKQIDGLSARPVGSYIHSDTLLNNVEVVKNAVQEYLDKGYIFDNAKSSQPLVLQADPDLNVFKLYFRTGEVKITFSSEGNGHLEEADGTKITGSKITVQVPGKEFVSVPTPVADEGYAFAGWTPELPETVPAADQTYTATFGVDSNGDGNPQRSTSASRPEQTESLKERPASAY